MIDGLLVIDKPAGLTSHDVVARCRKALGQRRVGHAGTLDPDATGVLLVGTGRVTRLLRFAGELPKRYEGELVLGVATTTLDAAGEPIGTWDMSAVTAQQVTEAAARLTGRIEQVPPMVSAVKIQGRRLHELARAGVELDRPARPVVVHRFDVWPAPGMSRPDAPPGAAYRFEVECSSGTYVRVLAADLGAALGGGAHLRVLRRTAIGPFAVGDAVALDDVTPAALLPPERAAAFLPAMTVDGDDLAAVRHGRRLGAASTSGTTVASTTATTVVTTTGTAAGTTAGAPAGPVAVLAPGGRLVAVYEPAGDELRPAVVLDPA